MARPRRFAPEPDYDDGGYGYPGPSAYRRSSPPGAPAYRNFHDDDIPYRPRGRGVPSRSPSPPKHHARHSRAYSPPPAASSHRPRGGFADLDREPPSRPRESRGRRPPSPDTRDVRPRRYYDESSDDDRHYRAPPRGYQSRPGSRQPQPPPARGRAYDEDHRYPPSSSRYGRRGYSPSPDRSRQQRHRSVPPQQSRPTPSRRRSSSANNHKSGGGGAKKGAMWGKAAQIALKAGAAAAFKERNEPGEWMGDKGAKVLSAAVGAAVVDSFMTKKMPNKKDGVRHHALEHAAEMGLGRAFSPAMKGARDYI